MTTPTPAERRLLEHVLHEHPVADCDWCPPVPTTADGKPVTWRLVTDFAADLTDQDRERAADVISDLAIAVDSDAEVYAGRPSPWPATDPCRPDPTTTAPQPATPGDALRRRLADAKRRLFAHIIASAHLLDKPFTNAPDQSPWSRMKHAMEGLNAAIAALDAAPTTWELPAEPPPDVLCVRDDGARHWSRTMLGDQWWRPDATATWAELLGRVNRVTVCGCLTTPPPTTTEETA